MRIAFVNPIFTTTAYQKNGFYDFYKLHSKNLSSTTYIRSDLSLLNVTTVNGWGAGSGRFGFIQTFEQKRYLATASPILTDIDINNGLLFSKNGSRMYDSVVVGFSEYVTAKEYQEYLRFVAMGGTLIFLNACNFLAQVQYNPSTGNLALVSGMAGTLMEPLLGLGRSVGGALTIRTGSGVITNYSMNKGTPSAAELFPIVPIR